jgi:hypothetical protein
MKKLKIKKIKKKILIKIKKFLNMREISKIKKKINKIKILKKIN